MRQVSNAGFAWAETAMQHRTSVRTSGIGRRATLLIETYELARDDAYACETLALLG